MADQKLDELTSNNRSIALVDYDLPMDNGSKHEHAGGDEISRAIGEALAKVAVLRCFSMQFW